MSTIKQIQNHTGASWLSVIAGLMVLAFFLYTASTGSLVKYKQLLF